jgi:hypothetical protein
MQYAQHEEIQRARTPQAPGAGAAAVGSDLAGQLESPPQHAFLRDPGIERSPPGDGPSLDATTGKASRRSSYSSVASSTMRQGLRGDKPHKLAPLVWCCAAPHLKHSTIAVLCPAQAPVMHLGVHDHDWPPMRALAGSKARELWQTGTHGCISHSTKLPPIVHTA